MSDHHHHHDDDDESSLQYDMSDTESLSTISSFSSQLRPVSVSVNATNNKSPFSTAENKNGNNNNNSSHNSEDNRVVSTILKRDKLKLSIALDDDEDEVGVVDEEEEASSVKSRGFLSSLFHNIVVGGMGMGMMGGDATSGNSSSGGSNSGGHNHSSSGWTFQKDVQYNMLNTFHL